MEGYVLNATSIWSHTMKRAVGPGMKIPLSELYEQYGVKHGLSEGEEFIEWLRSVKLKDKEKWKIIVETTQTEQPKSENPAPENTHTKRNTNDMVAPFVIKDMQISDITGLPVRKARDVIPHIMDLKLLQYAEREANQLSGKDSLCRILRKRIRELQMVR
jgi:hypothetical protein